MTTTTRRRRPRNNSAGHALRTEGQRRLRDLTESHRQIAQELGVSGAIVSCWRNGLKRPGHLNRRRLHELYGIEPGTWARVPGAAPEPEPPPPRAEEPEQETMGRLAQILCEARVARLDPELLPVDKAHLVRHEVKLLATMARLEERRSQRRRAEDINLREHPSFQRVVALLRAVAEKVAPRLATELEAKLEEAVGAA